MAIHHSAVATVLAALICGGAAHAQSVYVVKPIDGYVCKKLNVTHQEAMSPNGAGVTIRSAPSASAPAVAIAPSVLFVRVPQHVVGGFVEVLRIDGKPGWIATNRVEPFDPDARCIPSLMSNGRIGAG